MPTSVAQAPSARRLTRPAADRAWSAAPRRGRRGRRCAAPRAGRGRRRRRPPAARGLEHQPQAGGVHERHLAQVEHDARRPPRARRRAPAPARRRSRGRSRPTGATTTASPARRRVTENSGAGSTGAIFSWTPGGTTEGCLSTSITPSSPRATSSPRRATSRTCSVWRSRRRPAPSPSCASTTGSCCSSRPRRPVRSSRSTCASRSTTSASKRCRAARGARAGPLGRPALHAARHQPQPRRPWRVLPGPLGQLLRGDHTALRGLTDGRHAGARVPLRRGVRMRTRGRAGGPAAVHFTAAPALLRGLGDGPAAARRRVPAGRADGAHELLGAGEPVHAGPGRDLPRRPAALRGLLGLLRRLRALRHGPGRARRRPAAPRGDQRRRQPAAAGRARPARAALGAAPGRRAGRADGDDRGWRGRRAQGRPAGALGQGLRGGRGRAGLARAAARALRRGRPALPARPAAGQRRRAPRPRPALVAGGAAGRRAGRRPAALEAARADGPARAQA